MDTPEFPPNSEKSKRDSPMKRRISLVYLRQLFRRKKSLRKQFSETFVAGDAKTAVRYVVMDVLLPAAKDMIVEAGSHRY